MYHPSIIEKRQSNLADVIRRDIDPKFTFKEYSVEEVEARVEELAKLYNEVDGTLISAPSTEQLDWIRHEINRCKVDFLYWCTRYAFIKDKTMSLIRLNPTAVQQLALERIGKQEYDSIINKTGDGILQMILKARQLGISTLSDMIIAHRIFFYANTTALIAADVDERTPNLYEMVVRAYDHLPWFMQPKSADIKRDYRVKAKQLYFADQDSMIRFGSSANTQGGSSGETKGSLGTGMTLPLVHLSELALWSNPYQIDDALMPSIPMNSRTFVIFESTAKGRNNWWFDSWQDAKRGLGRCKPVFIPWYTDPHTYKLPAPLDWIPTEKALLHAERVKATSHRWLGKTVELSKDQLYWWERTRTEYASKRILYKFLAEYCADDEEAFQNTSHGIFNTELIDDMRQKARDPIYVEMKNRLSAKKYTNELR